MRWTGRFEPGQISEIDGSKDTFTQDEFGGMHRIFKIFTQYTFSNDIIFLATGLIILATISFYVATNKIFLATSLMVLATKLYQVLWTVLQFNTVVKKPD